jgi:drug/metabolite transporter (DMT)-like permease
MWFVVVAGALVAAFLNAVGSLTQRRATGQLEVSRLFRHDIVTEALQNKLWLLGGLAQFMAFVAQAVALKYGSLVVVGPLMTTDLVFLMLLLQARFNIGIGRREWAGAAIVAGGISLLLVAAQPTGSDIPYQVTPWLITIVAIGLIVLAGAIVMRSGPSPQSRAVVGGIAAGAHFSLVAALIKLVTQQLHFGILQLLTNWPLWALTIAGLSSFLTLQSMYGAGPLGISWPLAEICEAVGSILIGLLLFNDTINADPLAVTGEVVGCLVLAAGIFLLAGSRRLRHSEDI